MTGITRLPNGGRAAAAVIQIIDVALVAEFGPHIVDTLSPNGVRQCSVVHTCSANHGVGTLLVRVRRNGQGAMYERRVPPEWYETATPDDAREMARDVIAACKAELAASDTEGRAGTGQKED